MATIKLFESWLQSQALNEVAPHGILELAKLEQADGLHPLSDESSNMIYERVLTNLDRHGIIFSTSSEQAAKILASLFLNAVNADRPGLGSGASGMTELAKIDDWFKSNAILPQPSSLKLMDFPEDPSKVLTRGIITEDKIESPGNDSVGSEYEDIAKYFNNAALIAIAEYLWRLKNTNRYENLEGAGYKLFVGDTGVLDWVREGGKGAKFYGTTVTTSAQSKQVATTTTWEVPTTGKTIVKKFPGTMFATGQITLADSKALDAAIAELQTLKADGNTIITNIEIESSASGDKPVDGVNGYPPNTPAGKYPFGSPYVVKPTDTSANAKLAKGRGDTIKAKLTSLGVTPMVKAVIQDGLEEAQYAKITVTVKKKDKPTETFTKTDLETILLKPKQTTSLASTKTLSAWALYTN
jgi:hypothetical protein